MFKASNPALKTNTFAKFRDSLGEQAAAEANVMTLEGTITKTGLLLVLAIGAAIYPWTVFFSAADPLSTLGQIGAIITVGWLVTLALGIFTIFMHPKSSTWVAPLYAISVGVALGGTSALTEAYYPGIPLIATVTTFGVLGTMLTIYRLKIVKVTERFKGVVMTLVGTIMVVALVSILTSFVFGFSLLHAAGGMLGIGISLAIIVVFSLYLLVSFNEIEEGVRMRAPKWMEWYGAFGILVAMVWIYVEVLRIATILARE